MKMGIFALILLVVIITVLTLFNIYLKNSINEIMALTEKSVIYTENGNYKKATENNKKAITLWKKNEKIYELLTEKPKLDIITGMFNEATVLLTQNRYEESKTALSTLLFQFKDLINENQLNAETIL